MPNNPPIILGVGVHILLSNGEVREVKMNSKLAISILNLLKHRSPKGIIDLGHRIKIDYVQPAPVSREKGPDYISLARQLPEYTGPCMVHTCKCHAQEN